MAVQGVDGRSGESARNLAFINYALLFSAIFFPGVPALIAAMLGILRCGAAYVPVAVDAPAERRAFIAADAGIRHVVTRAAFAAQVAVAAPAK